VKGRVPRSATPPSPRTSAARPRARSRGRRIGPTAPAVPQQQRAWGARRVSSRPFGGGRASRPLRRIGSDRIGSDWICESDRIGSRAPKKRRERRTAAMLASASPMSLTAIGEYIWSRSTAHLITPAETSETPLETTLEAMTRGEVQCAWGVCVVCVWCACGVRVRVMSAGHRSVAGGCGAYRSP